MPPNAGQLRARFLLPAPWAELQMQGKLAGDKIELLRNNE